MQIGVLLLEPDKDMRYWLGRLIERTDGLLLEGSCSDAGDLEKMASQLSPRLILVDSDAATGLKPGALMDLREKIPGLHVIFAGLDGDGVYEKLAIESGADGFIEKGQASQSLVRLRQKILRMENTVAQGGSSSQHFI